MAPWTLLGAACYRLTSVGSWFEDFKTCTGYGGYLVVPGSTAEINYLFNFFKAYLGGNKGFWTGINDISLEGTYRIQGTTTPIAFNGGWNSNQPDNYLLRQNCVLTLAANGALDDDNCGYKLAGICLQGQTMATPQCKKN